MNGAAQNLQNASTIAVNRLGSKADERCLCWLDLMIFQCHSESAKAGATHGD